MWNLDIDNVGELGVSEALNLTVLTGSDLDGKPALAAVGGLNSGAAGPNVALRSPPSGDSSAMPSSDGLTDRLGGGKNSTTVFDMRTQFCRRCPFLAVGLPFIADGMIDFGVEALVFVLPAELCFAVEPLRVGVSRQALPEIGSSVEVFCL